MSEALKIASDDAIRVAFEQFDRLVVKSAPAESPKPRNVLLEGLEITDDDIWRVTIGFDLGRKRATREGLASMFGSALEEPVREFREFEISAKDGKFKRMS